MTKIVVDSKIDLFNKVFDEFQHASFDLRATQIINGDDLLGEVIFDPFHDIKRDAETALGLSKTLRMLYDQIVPKYQSLEPLRAKFKNADNVILDIEWNQYKDKNGHIGNNIFNARLNLIYILRLLDLPITHYVRLVEHKTNDGFRGCARVEIGDGVEVVDCETTEKQYPELYAELKGKYIDNVSESELSFFINNKRFPYTKKGKAKWIGKYPRVNAWRFLYWIDQTMTETAFNMYFDFDNRKPLRQNNKKDVVMEKGGANSIWDILTNHIK